MKRLLWALLVTSLLAPAARSQQIRPLAEEAVEVLDLLRDGQHDAVHARFAPGLANQLSKEDLAARWTEVLEDYGAFTRLADSREFASPFRTTTLLRCQFENAPLNLFVEYDTNRQIAALSFEPVATDVWPAFR
jgi:hypothetical protein